MIRETTEGDDEEEEEEEEDEDEDLGDHEFLIGGQLEGTKVGELAWLICDTPLSDIYEDFDLFITGKKILILEIFHTKKHSFIDPDQVVIKHTRIQDSGGRWRVEFETN